MRLEDRGNGASSFASVTAKIGRGPNDRKIGLRSCPFLGGDPVSRYTGDRIDPEPETGTKAVHGGDIMQQRTTHYRLVITRLALVVAAFGLAGCGGDDDDPVAPSNVDVEGDWTFQATGTDDTGRTCTVSSVGISIQRSASAIEGQMTGGGAGTIACSPGSTTSFNGSSPLDDIEQNGPNVEFTFQSSSGTWTVSGAIAGNGNSMNGAVTFFLSFSSSGVKQFTGTWSATRTS
jgi:hypothetical protein